MSDDFVDLRRPAQLATRRNQTGFKGVFFDRRRNKYSAELWPDGAAGKRLRSPRFDTPEEAGAWYDEKAREFYGETTAVNFPLNGERGLLDRLNAQKCLNGHDLTDANVYISAAGQRYCRACNRQAALRRYRRKRQLADPA
jgi:hypothetical protein